MRLLPALAALAACGTTSTPAPRSAHPLDVAVATWLPNPLAATFHLTAPAPGPVDVACAATDEVDDVVGATVTADRPEVAVAVAGLRPDTVYDCVVTAGGQVARVPVTVGLDRDPPPLAPVEGADGPWTTFVLLRGAERSAWIVDERGRPRWMVDLAPDPGTDPSSGWFAEPRGDELLVGGGRAFLPRTFDRLGGVVTRLPPPRSGEGVHHDASFAGGAVLALTWRTEQTGALRWDGFGVEQVPLDGRAPSWSWTSAEAVDAGDLPAPAEADPFHANAVRADPDGETVWVSLRNLSQLVRIDPATGAIVERIGADGDVTLPAGEAFVSQHDPTFVDDRIVLYDNGDFDRRWSRILELRRPDGAGEAEVLRTFTEEGWYEPVMGGVELLADGRWFVTRAHCDGEHCAGNDPEARAELLLVDPDAGRVDWRLRFTSPESTYRARTIDPCAWFGRCG